MFPFAISRPFAEDLVQNVLFKLWARMETLVGILSLEKYLMRMARNQLLDNLKKQAREQKYFGRIPVEEAISSHPTRKKDHIDVFRSLSEEKRKDTQMKAALDEGLRVFKEGKRQAYIDLIRQNPGSFASLDALKTLGGVIPDHDLIAPLFNSLAPTCWPSIFMDEAGRSRLRYMNCFNLRVSF